MGGTLKLLGTSDIDHVDSSDWYYSTDYVVSNLIARQLLTYHPNPSTGKYDTPPVADAADLPVISNGGKTYTFTIKQGVKWDTTPARQVTAEDFARGFLNICNPVAPFGASSYLTNNIVGFAKVCSKELTIGKTAADLKTFIDANLTKIPGLKFSGETLTVNLIAPANDFENIVALPFSSAIPVEYLNYAPDSAQLGQNLISDGPYAIQKYVPGKSYVFVRDPAWVRSTDLNRPSYVNEIDITTGLTQASVQQQIQAGTADMAFDTFPLANQVPNLVKLKDPGIVLSPTNSSNPYMVFNTVSPDENNALSKVAVRQAISYATNKTDLLQVLGGTLLNKPLNQVLPTVITGGETSYNDYPYDPAKAKSMLAAAGYPNGITLKLLYRSDENSSTLAAQTLQADLPKGGIKVQLVATTQNDFYSKYLQTTPAVTKQGKWDIAFAGWGADWDGNAAASFFFPLFDGRTFSPSSSNFGDFNDPKVNKLDDEAVSAPTVADAAKLWAEDDHQVMKDAPFVPLASAITPNYYNANKLAGFIYFDNFQDGSLTSVYFK